MAVGDVVAVVRLGLEVLRDHIEDPKRRLRAMQDYRDVLRSYVRVVGSERDMEVVDAVVLDFIAALREL